MMISWVKGFGKLLTNQSSVPEFLPTSTVYYQLISNVHICLVFYYCFLVVVVVVTAAAVVVKSLPLIFLV